MSEEKLTAFINIAKDFDNSEAIFISQEKRARKIGDVMVLPWMEALRKYFTNRP